jgi:hypothetical protein
VLRGRLGASHSLDRDPPSPALAPSVRLVDDFYWQVTIFRALRRRPLADAVDGSRGFLSGDAQWRHRSPIEVTGTLDVDTTWTRTNTHSRSRTRLCPAGSTSPRARTIVRRARVKALAVFFIPRCGIVADGTRRTRSLHRRVGRPLSRRRTWDWRSPNRALGRLDRPGPGRLNSVAMTVPEERPLVDVPDGR